MVLIVFIALSLFIFAACTITALLIYSKSFGRINSPKEQGFYSYLTWKETGEAGYSRKEVHFNSGVNKLQGFIYGGENLRGLVVISQGLGSTVESYSSLILHFVDRGWCVFAFNNTGVAGSGGKGTRGLYQSAIDLDAALTYVENAEEFNGMPVMLAGHSWGGFAVCAVLNYEHKVNAAVSFAGYNSGSEVLMEQGRITAGGFYYIIKPQMYILQKLLFGKSANLTAVDGINKSGIPVMIVQCSDDNLIYAGSSSIYAHREKITNPHVKIIYRQGEDATGHEYAFHSRRQKEYREWADLSWKKYKLENKDASQLRWAEEIKYDKALANELDPDLMEQIEELFNSAL